MQSALNKIEYSRTLIRRWLVLFMIVLVLSGLSVFPVVWGSGWLAWLFNSGDAMGRWMEQLNHGLKLVDEKYPFIYYGYDWMAFAHFLFAILFYGAWRDPVRNQWIVEFGMIACLLILPTALIAGHFRGIPLWWRFIDCSFGLLGLVVLSICNSHIWRMRDEEKKKESHVWSSDEKFNWQ